MPHPHTHTLTHNPRPHTLENEWEPDEANAKVPAYTGLVCFIFLICSLRTNIVFFLIFFTLVGAFGCLAAAYWNLALAYENAENTAAAKRAAHLVVVKLPPPPLVLSIPFPFPPFFLIPFLPLSRPTKKQRNNTAFTPESNPS